MKQIILLFSCLTLSTAFSQLDRSIRPTATEAPKINIEDSEIYEFENGLTVILSQNSKIPKVTFRLVMGSDPRLEDDKIGVGAITGELLSSGTEHRTKDELDNEIAYIGATLRTSSNSISLSCLTKHMDKGLELMEDVLKYPSFPQEEVDRILKMYESNLKSVESSPDEMASNATRRANFPEGHPYGEIMTNTTLANIDRNAILQYYKSTFTPQGSYLVIVGDVEKDKVKEIAYKYFKTWQNGRQYSHDYGKVKKNDGNRVIFVNKPAAVQSVIQVSFPVDISIENPDYLKLRVLNGILGGGGFQNRLMQNLREDKGYTYGAGSYINVDDHGSWFGTSGSFRNEVTDSAIVELLSEIQRITEEYVTKEELDITKSSMNGSFARSLERPSTIANFALNIIDHKLPADYYKTYLKRLDAITVEDILDVAQKYFTPSNCNIVVVGNEEVLPKIERFDADGIIEKMDAFGQKVKELKATDVTPQQIFDGYLLKVTNTSSSKKMLKKLKKLKSVKREIELTLTGMPGSLEYTEAYSSNGEMGKMISMNQNPMFREFVNGESGQSISQMGVEEFTEEEVKASNMTKGFFPEAHYKETGITVSVEGIETRNDKEFYLIKFDDGVSLIYEYYTIDFIKAERKEISTKNGQSVETVYTYSEYEVQDNGYFLPTVLNISIAGTAFEGKVKSTEMNSAIDFSIFK